MSEAIYQTDLSPLERKIGYQFHDQKLLYTALTHSSYTHELRSKNIHVECNERMEFLGDSILSYVTSVYLYSNYKNFLEGDLTRIRAGTVCENALYEYAKHIGLGSFLYLGNGEENTGGRRRKSILSDAFEAIIAAIFLDGGLEPAKAFVLPFVSDFASKLLKSGSTEDYKTLLQKFIQQTKGEILEYRLVAESGPAHDRHFKFEVLLNSNVIGRGSGSSKREAEQAAAKEALVLFGELKEEKA